MLRREREEEGIVKVAIVSPSLGLLRNCPIGSAPMLHLSLKVFILNANFVISQDLDRPCLDKHYCK
jgi:hypothetical protein